MLAHGEHGGPDDGDRMHDRPGVMRLVVDVVGERAVHQRGSLAICTQRRSVDLGLCCSPSVLDDPSKDAADLVLRRGGREGSPRAVEEDLLRTVDDSSGQLVEVQSAIASAKRCVLDVVVDVASAASGSRGISAADWSRSSARTPPRSTWMSRCRT